MIRTDQPGESGDTIRNSCQLRGWHGQLRMVSPILLLVAVGCSKARVQIDSPLANAHVQAPLVAVEAHTNAPEGSLAFASAGGPPAQARVAQGRLHFDVAVSAGDQVLQVSVQDRYALVAHASVPITADPAAGCRIAAPADGAVIAADPGDTGLAVVPVLVTCTGLGHPTAVRLLLDGWPEPLLQSLPAEGGTVSFDAQLLPGLNILTAAVPGLPLQPVSVTLQSSRCRADLLEPATGAVLNAALDRAPLVPGEQVRVVVGTGCPDGTPATLTLSAAAGARSVRAQVSGGRASFEDVTVPEGAVFAQAFVGAPGNTGASRRAHWFVDSLLPVATLDAPAPGAAVQSPVAFAGTATVDAQTSSAVLVLDEGAQSLDVTGPAWQLAVPLQPGMHVARVVVTRKSGNQTVSPAVAFLVLAPAGTVTIVSPADGAALNLTTLAPQPGGARALFQLRAPGPAGRSATVTCGATTSAAVPVPAAGDVAVPIDLPLGCGPAALTCTAAVGAVTSAAIHLTADAAAPQIALFSPPPGSSSTRQGTVDLRATTSCPGEAQRYELRNNGALVASGAVAGNAVNVTAVPLSPGQDNRLDLTVLDGSGNAGLATAHVAQLAGTPQVAVLSPAAGATLTAADDVDKNLSNGLQALVRVTVGNRPAGTQVDLTVASVDAGGAPRTAVHALTGSSLEADFSAVTLPEGAVTLTACVTDPVTPAPAPVCASAQVQVSTGRAICNVVAPADSALLTASSDTRPDLPGYQNDLRVQTSGAGGVTVTLTDPDGVTTTPPASPAGTGLRLVTFSSITFAGGDGSYTVDATCAGSTPGRALTNTVTLQTAGPAVAFAAPAAGAVFNAASQDTSAAAGFQTGVQLQTSAGASVALAVQCNATSGSYGPVTADGAGKAAFAGVTLLAADPGDEACKLTARATLGGVQGLPTQIAVTVDRTVPAPSFSAPTAGQLLQAPALDCSNPSAPVLKAATLALADLVPQAGLTLTVNGTPSAVAPAPLSGGWSWAGVAVVPGTNVLAASATDAAGNAGAAQVSFTARCGKVGLAILGAGPNFGYAQDKDHATPGEQLGVQVTATVPDGNAVRVCSSAGDSAQAPCATAGTFPLPPTGRVLSGGSVTYDVTFPDGPQTVVAELVDGGAAPSDTRNILVRSTPPRVTALAITENDADLSLNAAELAPTLHFLVTAAGAIAGQTLELHSTALGATVLGTATARVGQTTVPVSLPAVAGQGGYQSHVFYALVHDDAGNPDSIPGAEYPGDPALTLGTAAQPFVIAPAPSVSLQRPAAGTTTLLAADDTRCSGSACPGTDPLSYLLAAQTSAPDGSQAVFLLDGAQAGAAIGIAGGSVSAAELLANGPARALAVRITDPYGNAVTTAARTVRIDSVPPALTLVSSATLSTIPAAVTVQTGGSLEAGQTIVVSSDKDGVVGSAPCDPSGQTQVSISLTTTGAHQLTASARDVAGNPGSSAAVAIVFTYAGPTIALSQPAPSAQRIYFGAATAAAGRCAPPLQAATTRAQGGTATLWVAQAGDCSGAPSAEKATAPVPASSSTVSFALTFADGETGFLCAQVTAGTGTATTSAQPFGCDLSTPAVAWASPQGSQLFVAPPLGGRAAIASQGADPQVLVADFSVTATAVAGSTVTLADTAVFASQTLASACNACTVTFTAAQLPVAPAGALGHLLEARVTSPGGNVARATRSVQIDIDPPADAAPSITVTHRLGGVIHLAVASVPGDDGTAGASPTAWQVRWSLGTPLTRANWSSTGVLLGPALVPAPGTPGTAQAFDVVLPADSAQVWLGVRAVDRVGNLGAFTDQTSAPTLSLQLARVRPLAAGVPIATANAGNVAGRMRIADLDGDGFDDVVLSYPNDGPCTAGVCDGRLYVYFGAAGGFANAASPLVLSGTIPGGSLGYGSGISQGLGFDVGDFDGDGLADIVASETDCSGPGKVELWTGASIKALRQANTPLKPVVLTDGQSFLGGTVRAVKRVTGGAGAGDDLLLAAYTAGCGPSQTFSLAVLPRAGAWLQGTSAALSSAQATVTLPGGHLFGTADAAAIDALETGTTRQSLFVAFIDTSSGTAIRELRTLAGSALTSAVALTSGTAIAVPTGGGTDFGRFVGSGLDATGDGKNDLVLSGDKRVFLYDGSTLLSASPKPVATPAPDAAWLDVNGDAIANANVDNCALLLPDLTGDGLAEVSGCANIGQAAEVYFAFGGSPLPGLSFIDPAAPGSHRRQRIAGAGASFGQKIGAGHVTSKTGTDLVVLSESVSSAPQVELLR